MFCINKHNYIFINILTCIIVIFELFILIAYIVTYTHNIYIYIYIYIYIIYLHLLINFFKENSIVNTTRKSKVLHFFLLFVNKNPFCLTGSSKYPEDDWGL